MQIHVDLFTDKITGEVNESAMAEDACMEYKIKLNEDGTVPDVVYFQADQIARAHEIKTGAREGKINPSFSHYINNLNADSF